VKRIKNSLGKDCEIITARHRKSATPSDDHGPWDTFSAVADIHLLAQSQVFIGSFYKEWYSSFSMVAASLVASEELIFFQDQYKNIFRGQSFERIIWLPDCSPAKVLGGYRKIVPAIYHYYDQTVNKSDPTWLCKSYNSSHFSSGF